MKGDIKMETIFMVAYTRHNAKTGGNAYKVDFASRDLSEAKKKYHALLGEYIASEDFDFVSVVLYDSYGNMIMSEYWEAPTAETIAE